MMEVGRLCMKIAGRDANKICAIIEVYDDNYVLIDGETRRKKCNIKHLEPLDKVVKIKKSASREEVKKVFTELKLGFFEPKSKKPAPREKKVRVKREKAEDVPKKEKPKKEAVKKATTKKTEEKTETATEKDAQKTEKETKKKVASKK